MNCPEEPRSQSWFDGALAESESARAKAHIEGCAQCTASVESAANLRELIRRDALRYRAPQHLAARIARAIDGDALRVSHRRSGWRGFWLGTIGGVGASALAAAIALLVLLPPSPNSLLESVAQAHVNALMGGRTVAVASSNHHAVKPWFAGRVPLSPPVADFAAEGFTLAGGREDTIAGVPAAVLAYRHGRHEIDLFVWADRRSRLPAGGVWHGYHAMFWKSGDLDYAAVSDTESSELAKFAHLVKGERE